MEHEYRAWNIRRKKILPVSTIHYGVKGIRAVTVVDEAKDGNTFLWPREEMEMSHDIGLFDKNGKKIYTGDLVRWTYKDPVTKLFYTGVGEIIYIPPSYNIFQDGKISSIPVETSAQIMVEIVGNKWGGGVN